jgi:hypothetical protein
MLPPISRAEFEAFEKALRKKNVTTLMIMSTGKKDPAHAFLLRTKNQLVEFFASARELHAELEKTNPPQTIDLEMVEAFFQWCVFHNAVEIRFESDWIFFQRNTCMKSLSEMLTLLGPKQ